MLFVKQRLAAFYAEEKQATHLFLPDHIWRSTLRLPVQSYFKHAKSSVVP